MKEQIITIIRHPFGQGDLTSNGEQYCTAVTGVDDGAHDAVESVTIKTPSGYQFEELSFSLVAAMEVDGAGSTDDVLWKWQISDDNVSWDDLIAEQTLSNTNTFTDQSCSGVFPLTGGTNFLGRGDTIYLRHTIESSGSTDTVSGKTKSSSWVKMVYRGY